MADRRCRGGLPLNLACAVLLRPAGATADRPGHPGRSPSRPTRAWLSRRTAALSGMVSPVLEGSATLMGMDRLPGGVFASLDEAAEALGWSKVELEEAKARASEPRPERITDRDRKRARVLSEQVRRTREALDAVI